MIMYFASSSGYAHGLYSTSRKAVMHRRASVDELSTAAVF
jgi:hypothetical protein